MKEKGNIVHGNLYCSHSVSMANTDDASMRHCHDVYEIIYVLAGEGKFVIEGREYRLRRNSLVLIPPLEYHYVDIKDGLNYERCIIRFSEADVLPDVRELLSSFRKSPEDEGDFYISDMNLPAFTSFLQRIEFSKKIPEEQRVTYFSIILSELIMLLSAFERERAESGSNELGARVIRYLNEHMEDDVSLDSIARHFFVSKYYLCRMFKRYNGISVHGYINQKRVMHAKQLIEAGESASSAAYKVGFGDYSAFYRAYVKLVGKAPTA